MYSYLVFALLMLAALMAASARAESQTRQYINFNDGWKFTLGDNDIYKKTKDKKSSPQKPFFLRAEPTY